MKRLVHSVPVIVASALVLAACGASTANSPPTTTSTTLAATTTSSAALATNLVLTAQVRHSLLAAGASMHGLSISDYLGLAAGTTYYAFDRESNTYYAAARLEASPNSLNAQVGSQDDGSYNLFVRVASKVAWTVYNDGLGGVQGTKCPIVIPAAVLAVWNWKAKSCFPPAPS
ncbi:MAG: hypothetical protein WCA31_00760 [Acidimicrobiales bacterium]